MDQPVISEVAWNEADILERSNLWQFTCPSVLNTNVSVNERLSTNIFINVKKAKFILTLTHNTIHFAISDMYHMTRIVSI